MKRWIKRAAALLLVAVLTVAGTLTVSAENLLYTYPAAEGDTIEAPSAMLMYVGVKQDLDVVLYEKDVDTRYQPGALMRVAMLGYAMKLIEQNGVDMDTATGEYTLYLFNHYVSGTGLQVSEMNFGEVWTVRDLLTVCALQAAADSAVTLAAVLAGSPEQFVEGMNGYAAELGCTNSHFTNVTCLNEDGQYMSARDVMTFTRAALENTQLRKILQLSQYTVTPVAHGRKRSWPSSNEMIRPSSAFYYTYADGGKSGGTLTETSVVEFGAKDGYEYMAVVMGAPRKDEKGEILGTAYADARRLIRWGLLDFIYTSLAQKQEPVGRVPVDNCAVRDTVPLVPARDLSTVIGKTLNTEHLTRRVVGAPGRLSAPIAKGDTLGTLELYYEGKLVGSVPLVAGEDAPYDFLYAAWQAVAAFFTSVWFWGALGVLLLLGGGYVWLNVRYNRRRQKKAASKRKK